MSVNKAISKSNQIMNSWRNWQGFIPLTKSNLKMSEVKKKPWSKRFLYRLVGLYKNSLLLVVVKLKNKPFHQPSSLYITMELEWCFFFDAPFHSMISFLQEQLIEAIYYSSYHPFPLIEFLLWQSYSLSFIISWHLPNSDNFIIKSSSMIPLHYLIKHLRGFILIYILTIYRIGM